MPRDADHLLVSGEQMAEIEQQLARLWTSVLGVPVDDRHADFFALGGHSLKAMRLIAEVEKRFGVQLMFSELTQGPSLLEMAVLVRQPSGGRRS